MSNKKALTEEELKLKEELGQGGADDGEGQAGQEPSEEEKAPEVGEDDEDQEDFEGDWKEARKLLKAADTSTGWSIDTFDQRLVIEGLKTRFNNKERSEDLYNRIFSL